MKSTCVPGLEVTSMRHDMHDMTFDTMNVAGPYTIES
jgi:hypothetical protein